MQQTVIIKTTEKKSKTTEKWRGNKQDELKSTSITTPTPSFTISIKNKHKNAPNKETTNPLIIYLTQTSFKVILDQGYKIIASKSYKILILIAVKLLSQQLHKRKRNFSHLLSVNKIHYFLCYLLSYQIKKIFTF